jgi:membrane protein
MTTDRRATCAVLFDIDGTLIDSNDLHVEAWARAFAEAGHPQDIDAIHAQIGKGGDLLVPTLLPAAREAVRKAIDERHGAIFKAEYLARAKPFPSASDLVRRAHAAGLKVVLASSAKQDELEHYAGLLGIETLLDAATSIDDVETSKPAPDIFGVALDKIAPIAAAETIVVGDTPYDIAAAGKIGIAAIGLLSGGFAEATLRDAGAMAIYAHAAALLGDFDGSPLGRTKNNR